MPSDRPETTAAGITVEVSREDDGRWIAECGRVAVYGATEDEAVFKALAIVREIEIERLRKRVEEWNSLTGGETMSDGKSQTTAETRYIKDAIEGAELEMSIDSQIADYRRAIVVWLRRKEAKWRQTASSGLGAARDAASFYAAAYSNAADGIERGEPERKMADQSPTTADDIWISLTPRQIELLLWQHLIDMGGEIEVYLPDDKPNRKVAFTRHEGQIVAVAEDVEDAL